MEGDQWRRRDDQEMARWRGSIDARVGALEREVNALAAATAQMNIALTRVQGDVKALRRELGETRDDIKDAAKEIDDGATEKTNELKAAINNRAARSFSLVQIAAAMVIAIIGPAVGSLITIAITGGR